MITDEQFKKAIEEISDQYEALKDCVWDIGMPISDSDRLLGKIAKFRDTACTALRESHTTKNFDQN